VVSASEDGCETGHARYQNDGDEHWSDHIANRRVVGLTHVGIQVPVQDRARQARSNKIQAEVDHHERRRHAPANAERHRCPNRKKSQQLSEVKWGWNVRELRL
jgi:hypothetical protein